MFLKTDPSYILQNEEGLVDVFELLVEEHKENVQDVVTFVSTLLLTALNGCMTTLPERYVFMIWFVFRDRSHLTTTT